MMKEKNLLIKIKTQFGIPENFLLIKQMMVIKSLLHWKILIVSEDFYFLVLSLVVLVILRMMKQVGIKNQNGIFLLNKKTIYD